MILEYLGVVGVLLGQYLRIKPETIKHSFVATMVGSALLFLQTSLVTHQYGFMLLNIISVYFALLGYINWRKINVSKGRKRKS